MLHRRSTASAPGPQAPTSYSRKRAPALQDEAQPDGISALDESGTDPGDDPLTASLDFDDPSPNRRDVELDQMFGVRSGEGDVSGPFDGAWSPRDAADLVDGLDGDPFDLDPYD